MKKIFFGILTVLLILSGIIYFVFIAPMSAEAPPVMLNMEPFEMTNSDGKKFSSEEELKGNIWVANFIFTSCRSVCPIMSRKMSELYRSYELEKDIRFVSVSVDPKRDTPEKLTAYAKKYKADTSKWFFLTGAWDTTRDVLIKKFKIAAPEDPVFHSDRFVLVDHNSKIRGYYEFEDRKHMRRLFHDIALVLKEKKEKK